MKKSSLVQGVGLAFVMAIQFGLILILILGLLVGVFQIGRMIFFPEAHREVQAQKTRDKIELADAEVVRCIQQGAAEAIQSSQLLVKLLEQGHPENLAVDIVRARDAELRARCTAKQLHAVDLRRQLEKLEVDGVGR